MEEQAEIQCNKNCLKTIKALASHADNKDIDEFEVNITNLLNTDFEEDGIYITRLLGWAWLILISIIAAVIHYLERDRN